MAQPVREEGHTCTILEDGVRVSFQYSELQETSNSDLVSVGMDIIPKNAFLELRDAFSLHLQDNIINCPTFLAEFAADWECPSDVSSITVALCSSIQEEVQLSGQGCVIADIVQCRGSRSRRDNAGVCLIPAALFDADLEEEALQLLFIRGMLGSFHNGEMCSRGDLIRSASECDLVSVLEDA